MNRLDKIHHDINEDKKYFLLDDDKYPEYLSKDEFYAVKHYADYLKSRLTDIRSSIGKAYKYALEETFSTMDDLLEIYENAFKAWERGMELIEKEGDKK